MVKDILPNFIEIQRSWESDSFIGTGSVGHNCFLRNRKTGHTYSLDVMWNKMTDVFLEDLKTTFKDVNFIGIRVLSSRDAWSIYPILLWILWRIA